MSHRTEGFTVTGPETADRFAEAWRAHHAYLVDLAFRVLGDIGEAEDVVQEAFARLARSAPGEIKDERGWLTVVSTRLCLDQIRSARSRREHPQDTTVLESISPLAQVPPVDPADRITMDDDVRLALFVVLERLSPAERVAFVLHDVFQTPFEAIAEILGRPITTCRQLARRARQKIADTPLRPNAVRLSEHRLVTEKFITACSNGDLDALLAVLHPRVWGMADFAVEPPIRPQVNHGADLVAQNLIAYYGHGATLVPHPVRGRPTVLAFFDRMLCAVITLTVEHDLITKIHVIVDLDTIALPAGPPPSWDRTDPDQQRR
ncbi:RNA polymerase sigma factor SigI [Streptantibioticus ferralitis]|uniref:RNA polymerase sigma factor SigI n=1 Tax=Streptantibioticus ferralitis TaxID=236510 RepID=A0ABT5ZA82_9ACTN|nr:RNA polymerase sigma factor SigI [Streptantibioticus ferralitis]MDF2260461.1 RNA polymerase sigma factor SigI [Streptantibioticus ferralitis]